MKGQLTTHVLDLRRGGPAHGLPIELYRRSAQEFHRVKRLVSNRDGRTDEPLLTGDEMVAGWYEIVFAIGQYLNEPSGERFLDEVPVRFCILDVNEKYHVPLLFTPWAYSTYRGS